MSMERPLVSVIIRTKDRPDLVARAVMSVSEQEYRNIEVVMVNDGGCDIDTIKIASMLNDLAFVYVKHERSLGRARAANTGLERCSGEYVLFLDDDDVLYENCVNALLGGIMKVDADMCYGRSECYRYSNGQKSLILTFGRPMDLNALFYRNFIPINSMLFRKAIIADTGVFDPDFEIFEDWDFIFRLASKVNVVFIEDVVSEYSVFESATITYKGGYEYHRRYWDLFYKKHSYFFSADVLDFCIEKRVDEAVCELRAENQRLRKELDGIYNSRAWKAVGFYRKLKRLCGF